MPPTGRAHLGPTNTRPDCRDCGTVFVTWRQAQDDKTLRGARHNGGNQCCRCSKRTLRPRGPHERTEILLDRWYRLASRVSEWRFETYAAELGITPDALQQMLYRARKRKDPRAIYHVRPEPVRAPRHLRY